MMRSTLIALIVLGGAACTHSVVRLSPGEVQPSSAPFALTLPPGCVAEKSDTAQAKSAGRGSYRCQGYRVIYVWGNSVVTGVQANLPSGARVVDSTAWAGSMLISYRFGRDAHGLLRVWNPNAETGDHVPITVRTESVFGGTQTAMRAIIESVRSVRQ